MIQVTDTVQLRLFKSSDADALFSLVDHNRSHLRKWLPWLDSQTHPDNTAAFIEGSLERWKNKLSLVLALVDTETVLGVVSFNTIDHLNKQAAIGYWAGEEAQGKGLVSASVEALIRYGRDVLDLKKITISCAEKNTKSIAVAERLGFSCVGREENKEWLYDHYVSHALYEKIM